MEVSTIVAANIELTGGEVLRTQSAIFFINQTTSQLIELCKKDKALNGAISQHVDTLSNQLEKLRDLSDSLEEIVSMLNVKY